MRFLTIWKRLCLRSAGELVFIIFCILPFYYGKVCDIIGVTSRCEGFFFALNKKQLKINNEQIKQSEEVKRKKLHHTIYHQIVARPEHLLFTFQPRGDSFAIVVRRSLLRCIVRLCQFIIKRLATFKFNLFLSLSLVDLWILIIIFFVWRNLWINQAQKTEWNENKS